jgi:predicted site-specific integrase-resolvase
MYVTPNEAGKYYGVSENALRVWARDGRIKFITTKGGHRRYLLEQKENIASDTPQPLEHTKLKIVYARVSSRKQTDNLETQISYLKSKYPNHTLITDIGSGINFQRTGLKRILEGVFKGTISEAVVAYRDRFARFGYELFEWGFEQHGARLLCDKESESTEDQELSDDLMAIVTVFTARFHGKRRYRNRLL